MGLKICVGVYLLQLVSLLLQNKWGTIFRQEWFWRMQELEKRNGKGVWMREIEKMFKRFDASLEWLVERIDIRDEEIKAINENEEMEADEKAKMLRTKGWGASRRCLKRWRCSSTHTSSSSYINEIFSFSEECDRQPELNLSAPLQEDPEIHELHIEDNDSRSGDPGEPPVCWEEE